MSVNEKMTAIADAIRVKTGKTGSLTLDRMAAEIAGIVSGGGIEPTASFLTKGEISQTIAAYPFKPRHKNELIVWNTTGANANNSGSLTPYAFFLLIVNGSPSKVCAWITGTEKTAPWADGAFRASARTDSFSLNEQGELTVATGTWGFCGANNTCTIYELPLPIGLEV